MSESKKWKWKSTRSTTSTTSPTNYEYSSASKKKLLLHPSEIELKELKMKTVPQIFSETVEMQRRPPPLPSLHHRRRRSGCLLFGVLLSKTFWPLVPLFHPPIPSQKKQKESRTGEKINHNPLLISRTFSLLYHIRIYEAASTIGHLQQLIGISHSFSWHF